MIVPVWLSHPEAPEEVLVYALLDSQSDTTFILKDTYDKLGLTGTSVTLNLSTMAKENMLIKSRKISGLKVRGFKCDEHVDLPPTYVRDIMPADRSHIPSPEVASKWPYLEKIAGELMKPADIDIALLIGYNCTRALAPRDVILPVGNGPFAQRTDLGWGIVGVVDHSIVAEDIIGVSHRLLTRDTDVDHAQVTFSFRSQIKEVIDPSS